MSVVPEAPILTKESYASPTSFIGATRRLVRPILSWGQGNLYADIAIWVFVIVPVLAVVYALIGSWYVIIFGAFGIFVIPWRLHRRSERKRDQVQRVQLASMQAMMGDRMRHNDDA